MRLIINYSKNKKVPLLEESHANDFVIAFHEKRLKGAKFLTFLLDKS